MEPNELPRLSAVDAGVIEYEENGGTVEAILLQLSGRVGTKTMNLPALLMSAAEARSLALQLVDVAGRMEGSAGTPLLN